MSIGILSEFTIRKAIRENPQAVKALLLTDHECRILRIVENMGGCTSAELFKGMQKKFPLQSLSAILAKLHRKGYLKRAERTQESGGVEYFYEVIV